jgi:hypothetical protein
VRWHLLAQCERDATVLPMPDFVSLSVLERIIANNEVNGEAVRLEDLLPKLVAAAEFYGLSTADLWFRVSPGTGENNHDGEAFVVGATSELVFTATFPVFTDVSAGSKVVSALDPRGDLPAAGLAAEVTIVRGRPRSYDFRVAERPERRHAVGVLHFDGLDIEVPYAVLEAAGLVPAWTG